MKPTLLILICALPAAVAAQVPAVPPGTRVRIEGHDKSRIEGTLMSQSGDSLVVASPRSLRMGMSTEQIARVRRGDGKSHAHGTVQGLKWGAGIGGGAILVLSSGLLLSSGGGTASDWGYVAGFSIGGAISGGFYGLLIGSVIGAEKWTTLYTAAPRVSLVPGPGSAPGLALKVSF
jgi:hypothetical protein